MSTPEIRRLRAAKGSFVSHFGPDEQAMAGFDHLLSVERAAVAIGALDQRRLTEDQRARLRAGLNGMPDPGPVPARLPGGPGSHGHTPRPGRMSSYAP